VRRLMTGALLMIVGILAVLFAPAWGVDQCVDCIGNSTLAIPITWSGDWGTLFLQTVIVGLALMVTGIVFMVRARGSKP